MRSSRVLAVVAVLVALAVPSVAAQERVEADVSYTRTLAAQDHAAFEVAAEGGRRRRVTPLLATLLLAIPGFALVFSLGGIVLGLLSLPVAAAILIAMNVAILPEWRAAFFA